MAILNYTTKIDAFKTVAQIQQTLAKKGAAGVSVDYDASGNPSGLTFLIDVNGQLVRFRLPSNYAGVRAALERDRKVPKSFKSDAQAVRVAWRIVKDWTEAQMAIIEAGLATLPEVFLAYAVAPDGRTLYEHFDTDGPRLLTAASAA